MRARPVKPIALITRRRLLSYHDRLELRDPLEVELVVIHCTELPDLDLAREYGERIHYPESRTGNSGHYYIDRDGTVEEWVEPGRVAHHVRGHNRLSIGIELVNRGRWPHWYHSAHQEMTEPYPDSQIGALCRLLSALAEALPRLRRIAGHQQLDTDWVPASDDPGQQVRRKLDPGPCFPWEQVEACTDLKRLSQ